MNWTIAEASDLIGGSTRYVLTHPEYERILVIDDNRGKRTYTWQDWGGAVEHLYRIQAGAAINRFLEAK